MNTKYNLEKIISSSRSLLDILDKVSFKEFKYLESDTNNPTSVTIDLVESNYFCVDLLPFNAIQESFINVKLDIINIDKFDIKRFEVLVYHGPEKHLILSLESYGVPILFPWGRVDRQFFLSENHIYYSIFSFRVGKSLNNKKEIIGVQSQWIMVN